MEKYNNMIILEYHEKVGWFMNVPIRISDELSEYIRETKLPLKKRFEINNKSQRK